METAPANHLFNKRAFVSLAMLFSAVILPVSGIMNHDLGLSGLTRERHLWMSVHNSAAALFVIFATIHIILNWKPLVRHAKALKDRVVSREAIVAIMLVAGIVGVFASHALHAG